MTVPDTHHGNGNAPTRPKRILLVSLPRTASNLLLKVLNIPAQPNVTTNEKGGYFFYPAFVDVARSGYTEMPSEEWTATQKEEVRAIYQSCFDSLDKCAVEANEAGKTIFMKEHASWLFCPASFQKMVTGVHDEEFFNAFRVKMPENFGPSTYSLSNETIFSDEYLRSWQMVFIIRHPALAWPSYWRAMLKFSQEGIIDNAGLQRTTRTSMAMRWSRVLYDWYMEQGNGVVPPPILDAYDLINNRDAVVTFCTKIGLDPNALQFEWDAQQNDQNWASDKAKAKAGNDVEGGHIRAANIMLSTLTHSSGVVKNKTPENVDIDAELVKWKAEFGDEIAKSIETSVAESMPDYEYLKARRLLA
ncbi:hypothetical protein N7493_008417 [Penicillium malachiteum]|uniref:Sulfotransferase domain-containing protein n=1 Tax=Penicillium malachiteum TaxID=1324776 RepID=A0AAD6HH34_9EURO|nr:hypothetical protein N7493_008417 [Penicillium malachiteum]